MTTSLHRSHQARLRTGTAALGLVLALVATPAFAQTQPAPSSCLPLRRRLTIRPLHGPTSSSPVRSSGPAAAPRRRSLRRSARTISTSAASTPCRMRCSRWPSTTGPALTNSSSDRRLRRRRTRRRCAACTTNSTLVLFDGLRAAYYPLADDATATSSTSTRFPTISSTDRSAAGRRIVELRRGRDRGRGQRHRQARVQGHQRP